MILLKANDSSEVSLQIMKIINQHKFVTVDDAERRARKVYKWLASVKHIPLKERKPNKGIQDGLVMVARCDKVRQQFRQREQARRAKAARLRATPNPNPHDDAKELDAK